MTDILDSGEIARPVDRATLGRVYQPDPPTEVLFRPPADETARIELGHTPGYALVLDLRPASPDTHGPSPLYRPATLADTMFALDTGGYPPVPPPPPPPAPAWAQAAGEYPVVKPLLRRGQHRQPISRLSWALVGSGVTVLVIFAALVVSVLLGVQW